MHWKGKLNEMDEFDARASDFRVRIHDGSGSLQQFDVPLLFLNL